jgi:hypothetical protein
MSDLRVRALERRFRGTGALEDEAAWLAERLRIGEVTRERVELAGLCEHRAACVVLGIEGGIGSGTVRAWADRLVVLGGRVAAVRAIFAAARRLSIEVEGTLAPEWQERRLALVEAVNGIAFWLAAPSTRVRKSALRRIEKARFLGPPFVGSPRDFDDQLLACVESTLARAGEALGTGDEAMLKVYVASGCGGALGVEGRGLLPAGSVMAAIRLEVAPWALGLAPGPA